MLSYINAFERYAVFRGRSTRVQFWSYTLVNLLLWGVIVYCFLKYPRGLANNVVTAIGIMYFVITIVPTLALISRRWHDIGRTGLWTLLNLVPGAGTIATLCFFLYHGDRFTNKYGRDPYDKKLKRRRSR